MRKINTNKIFDIVNISIMLLIVAVMLYPLYFTIIASVSEPVDVATGKVYFWPTGFVLDGYKEIFKNKEIWRGYRNSIFYTAVGTLYSLALTIPTGYVLSKKKLPFHGALTTYFVFLMYFSGGLIPGYLLVQSLNLINKPYTLIFLGVISIYNVIITRTFFTNSIPESLYEAAEVDGCSEFRKFFEIALPLSKAIIAVIALYYAVGRWNDYFLAQIYISNREYYPLQTVLKNILLENQMALAKLDVKSMKAEELLYMTRKQYMAEAMKYGIIFIASLPMLVAYPFVQKYFVKGVMIGSIKG